MPRHLTHPGVGHAVDNVVVWIKDKKILFSGCFVKHKNLGNLSDSVIEDWPQSTEYLLSRYESARMVIHGNGTIGGLSLLEKTKSLARKGGTSAQLKESV